MRWRSTSFLPSGGQRLLLRTALLERGAALDAWAAVRTSLNLDRLDGGSLRLMPLVFDRLRGLGVDDPLLPRLRGLHRRAWYANRMLLHRAGEVLQRLHEAGMRTMVLKGAALIAGYYRGPGLRPMGDVDVLVPADRAREAIGILERDGWSLVGEHDPAERVIEHGVGYSDGEGTKVDIHWRALDPAPPEAGRWADPFWERAVPAEVGGVATWAPCPADLLLQVCAHGAVWDQGVGPYWVADAVLVMRAGEVDWGRLVTLAAGAGLAPPLREALGYLRRELGAPVDAGALRQLERLPRRPRHELAHRGLRRDPRGPVLGGALRTLGYYSRVTARWGWPETIRGLSPYLRYRWGLERTSQLPVHLVRKTGVALVSRIRRRAA